MPTGAYIKGMKSREQGKHSEAAHEVSYAASPIAGDSGSGLAQGMASVNRFASLPCSLKDMKGRDRGTQQESRRGARLCPFARHACPGFATPGPMPSSDKRTKHPASVTAPGVP